MAAAAVRLFDANPGLRPRSAEEAVEMAAQAEEDYLATHTRVVEGKHVERRRNGVVEVVPFRVWVA